MKRKKHQRQRFNWVALVAAIIATVVIGTIIGEAVADSMEWFDNFLSSLF